VFVPKFKFLLGGGSKPDSVLFSLNLDYFFTIPLAPILSETPKQNQTKEVSPPPLTTTRNPAKKFSLHF